MNANPVNVAVLDGKTITESVELRTTSQGDPVRIKAVHNGKYVLAEGTDKPVGPENITIKRVGADLHVATEGGNPDQPQLIIEGFFESEGQLIGVAEDGAYYQYISSDGDQDHDAAFLHDGVASSQVLGSQELVGFGNGLVGGVGLAGAGIGGIAGSGLGMFGLGMLGLGALAIAGGAYAIVEHNKDDDNNDNSGKTLPTPILGEVTVNVDGVQRPIISGESTNSTIPTFSGTGTPGNSIVIEDNGKVIGEAVIGADGNWEITPGASLGEGDHNIVVVEVDKDGNHSGPTDGFDIIVDITPPAKPGEGTGGIEEVTDNFGPIRGPIGDGDTTDDTTPSFGGVGAIPGDTVSIIDNGVPIGDVVVGEDGTWTWTPESPLDQGEHSIVVVITDPAGNASDPSDPYVVIVDSTNPGKPGDGTGGIEEAIDNVGPVVDIGNGGITNDDTPTFSGENLVPGSTVEIIDNGVPIGDAVVGDDGKWTWTPDPALGEGDHEIVIVVTDPEGNPSNPSDPYIVIVDTTAPDKPGAGTGGIEEVTDNFGPIRGPIGDGDTTDDTTPTFGGTGATPGDSVVIVDNGVPIDEVVVGEDGTWTWTPESPLDQGEHSIEIVITDPAGNASEPSDPYVVIVDSTNPGKPGDGTGGIEEAIDNVGPVVDIGNGGITNDDTPTFSGENLVPGSTVEIIDNGVPIGDAVVGDDGKWTWTPDPALGEGDHEVVVVVTDPDGNPSNPSDPYIVIVDTTAPDKPGAGTGGIEEVTDNVGPIRGPISDGDTTDDTTPTFGGVGATPGDSVSIIDNGVPIDGVTVGADGTWTWTPDSPLDQGEHSIEIVITDPAGNASEPSDPYVVIVDSTNPGKPGDGTGGIEEAIDNVGPVVDIGNGGTTNDDTPTFSGENLVPGSTVEIIDNGVPIGDAVVGDDGKWVWTPDPALEEGNHDIIVVVTDPDGNSSNPSDPYIIIVDTTAPDKPDADNGGIKDVIDDVGPVTEIGNGDTTNDDTPTFSGEGGNPGDMVSIIIDGDVIKDVPVDEDGKWSYTPDPALEEGRHEIGIVITDPAGNASEESEPYIIIVDTTAPTVSAVVESMGKDSGANSNDFITNDGTAGRLIQGSLTAGLSVGEKVQVSTDGGITWLDALVDGTAWSFIDQNRHSADWQIETRVVDSAGNSNDKSQDVTLNQSIVEAPESVVWDGENVIVKLPSDGASAGDVLHIIIDGVAIEHSLTDAEISNGAVEYPLAGSLNESPDDIRAALVDSEGNVSDYQVFSKVVSAVFSENFSEQADTRFVLNQEYTLADFTVTATKLGSDYGGFNTGFGTNSAAGDGAPTRALEMGTGGAVLDLKITNMTPVNTVSMQVGDLTTSENLTAVFYNAEGDEIYRQELTSAEGPSGLITCELPFGQEFTSMTLTLAPGPFSTYVWLDNIEFGHYDYEAKDGLEPAAIDQTIVDAGAYLGGDDDNTFSIADVSVLNNGASEVHGGSGLDTLTLTGGGQTLDLSNLGEKISSIEVIDITGTGSNTLNLSLGDILEQGSTSLFTEDDAVQMMVKGNSGDRVNLDDLLADGTDPGDWSQGDDVTVDGTLYHVYQHSSLDAQLLVQEGVTTSLV